MIISRRQLVLGAGASLATAVAAQPLLAAGHKPASATVPGQCILTPQAVEGPYYFDAALVRSDITEDKHGVPVSLQLQVNDLANCLPIAKARVDVWHADAEGKYSGFGGDETAAKRAAFLRGTQFTDDLGLVTFRTLYPGWYRGRTAHIHFKVFLDEKNVMMGQLYFPDALSEYIYKNVAPYNGRKEERDTVNSNDGVLKMSGGTYDTFCTIREEKEFYLAALTISVDRNAKPMAEHGPKGPPPGMGKPPGEPPPGGGPGPGFGAPRPKGPLVPR